MSDEGIGLLIAVVGFVVLVAIGFAIDLGLFYLKAQIAGSVVTDVIGK